MRFNPAEYETVDERIHKFYADNPEGSILTELASADDDWTQCRYVATILRNDGTTWSTGYAYEIAGTQARDGANFGSHEENCETSAIGRALANAGYSGAKRPSRDEMNSAKGKQEATADRAKVSKRIAAEIKAYAEDNGMDSEMVRDSYREFTCEMFGLKSSLKATTAQLATAWEKHKTVMDKEED